MRISAKPQVYACAHLANSASLLLPVSNLTNLLAFHASHLSFLRFAALMVLPTIAAVAVEWVVFTRFFEGDLSRPRHAGTPPGAPGAAAVCGRGPGVHARGLCAELGRRDRAGVVCRCGRGGDHDPRARPQDHDPGGVGPVRRARVSDLRPGARGDRRSRQRQRTGHRGPRRAPDRQFAACAAGDRRR